MICRAVEVECFSEVDLEFLRLEGWRMTWCEAISAKKLRMTLQHQAPTEYQIERLHQRFSPAPILAG